MWQIVLLGLVLSMTAQAGEWSGSLAGEWRYFPHKPLSEDQFEHSNLSFALKAEYVHTWDDYRQVFAFVPFVRVDQHDPERTHADIRELAYVKATEDWELRLGIRKVFWGVTEFQHLVDIINQTDLVEDPDGEEKLGQPMVNLALIRDWGTLDFFVLPGFRERTFTGRKGRPRSDPPVDTDQARYESAAAEKHTDVALRWSKTIDQWDIGLAHFYGTSREPGFEFGLDGANRPVLIPAYDLINQTSLDLQYTGEEWLWKLEALSRDGQGERYAAATGGFEYTLVGVFESNADLGIIGEYAFDERGDEAPTLFQNDIVIGTRLALNDEQSSELLAGVAFDLDGKGQFYSLEASRRLGDDFKLNLEARLNSNIPADDLAFSIRNEDFIQLELEWFF